MPEQGQASTVAYANLLHRHKSPDAEEVKAYRSEYAADPVFSRRAEVLDILYANRDQILKWLKEEK